jgi:hypothetical protein
VCASACSSLTANKLASNRESLASISATKPLCLIRQVQQQRISAFEITDLSRSQMKPDGSALIIAHGMKF